MIDSVASHILALPAWVALLVVFALPALESSAFVGFVFPGEIALVLGGVLASEGRVPLRPCWSSASVVRSWATRSATSWDVTTGAASWTAPWGASSTTSTSTARRSSSRNEAAARSSWAASPQRCAS